MPTTLAQLRTQAQARADFEFDTNVTNASWASFINGSRKRLRRLLVGVNPQLFLNSKAFTLAGATYQYDLLVNAPTFWKSLALDFTQGTGVDDFQQIGRFMWHERNRPTDRVYRVTGNTLEIRPQRMAAGSYVLWYIEQPAVLAADVDALTLAEDIYDEFIILDAATKARRRQQKDAADLTRELVDLVADIKIAAADNDVGEPDRVLEVDSSPFWRPRLPPP